MIIEFCFSFGCGFVIFFFLILSAGIHVKCGKDSAIVTWKMTESLAETPFKLVLGECFPSKFSSTADGEREAVFHYHFSECLFRQKVKK